jgi:hypothetical protein
LLEDARKIGREVGGIVGEDHHPLNMTSDQRRRIRENLVSDGNAPIPVEKQAFCSADYLALN